MDGSKFALLGDERLFVYQGHVKNDRIYVDNRRIEPEAQLFYCKLENGKMTGFFRIGQDEHWEFVEHDLSANPIQEITNLFCSGCPHCLDIRCVSLKLFSKL